MKYLAYPNYTESSASWIEAIPSHWVIAQLKRKFRITNGSTPQASEPLYWDGEITWITPADFKLAESGYVGKSTRTITVEGLNSCGTSIVPKNSVILTTRAPIGGVAQAGRDLCTNQGCKSLVVDADDVHERFVFYVLSISSDQLNALGLGTTFMELSTDVLGYYGFALPPLKEQKHIAVFLDWKTAQIDALIAKKQTLIEKLKEKRLAVITQAVTKGLDPAEEMSQSGVPFLGEIPSNWIVKRLRYCAETVTSGSRGWAQYFSELGSLFLRITNLDRESISLLLDDTQRVDPPEGAEGERTLTRAGDLLISITADLGSVAVVPENLEPAYVSQHLSLVRLEGGDVEAQWIAYSIMSLVGEYQLSMAAYGGTKIQLSLSDIKNITFCYPPSLQEQRDILKRLGKEIERTDNLIQLSTEAINRLIEYRTALITAATTGKIDVRQIEVPTQR